MGSMGEARDNIVSPPVEDRRGTRGLGMVIEAPLVETRLTETAVIHNETRDMWGVLFGAVLLAPNYV